MIEAIRTETANLPLTTNEILAPYKDAVGEVRFEEITGDYSICAGYQINVSTGQTTQIIEENWLDNEGEAVTRITVTDTADDTVFSFFTFKSAQKTVSRKTHASPVGFCQVTQAPRLLVNRVFLPSISGETRGFFDRVSHDTTVSEIIEAQLTPSGLAIRKGISRSRVQMKGPQITIKGEAITVFTNSAWAEELAA